ARRLGAVYTPADFARATARAALHHGAFERGVLDPCCGAGSLLLGVFESMLDAGLREDEILTQLHGIDIDPVAVWSTRVTLALALGNRSDEDAAATLQRQIVGADVLATHVDEAAAVIAGLLGRQARGWGIVVANPP